MNLLCVIRHVGERTLKEATRRAIKCFGEENVVQINETPFFQAVIKTFELGEECSSKKFLLALDADVLLTEDACSLISQEWEKYKQKYTSLFRLDYLVRDKFRGRVYAGCHLYLNEYSRNVVSFLKNKENSPTQKRPESSNVKAFASAFGLKSKDGKAIVGVHDFDQYYKHIYVKYLNRAIRDRESFLKIHEMIAEKKRNYPEDFDFTIALAALDAVQKGDFKEMNTNAKLYPSIGKVLDELGIVEKSSLDI